MATKPKIESTKQIQLTINKLTKDEYKLLTEISAHALSTELSDQLFMTTDDAGGSGGNADIIYMSPEEYAEKSAAGQLDEEKYYATSAVGMIDPTILTGYALLSGNNTFIGNNIFTNLSANTNLTITEGESLESATLLINALDELKNVKYIDLYNKIYNDVFNDIVLKFNELTSYGNAIDYDNPLNYSNMYWNTVILSSGFPEFQFNKPTEIKYIGAGITHAFLYKLSATNITINNAIYFASSQEYTAISKLSSGYFDVNPYGTLTTQMRVVANNRVYVDDRMVTEQGYVPICTSPMELSTYGQQKWRLIPSSDLKNDKVKLLPGTELSIFVDMIAGGRTYVNVKGEIFEGISDDEIKKCALNWLSAGTDLKQYSTLNHASKNSGSSKGQRPIVSQYFIKTA